MDKNIMYTEFFDKYLKGKLSENERVAFEEKVSRDPLLQSEVKLQKDIFTELGNERKALLKQRLNQIPIDNTSWFGMQHFKWAAVAASALIVGAGMYYYTNTHEREQGIAVHEGQTETVVEEPSAIAEEEETVVKAPAPVVADEPKAVEMPAQQEEEKAAMTADASKAQPKTMKEEVTPALPEIKHPDLHTSFAEDTRQINYADFDAPQKGMIKGSAFESNNTDVEAILSNQYDFHYQFTDSKLYLYGDFSKALYKIIALNYQSGKRLFLEYEGHFYGIDNQQTEIVPLEQIEDSVLIKELKHIYQKNH